jgi:hypothetical protein
MPNTQSKVSAIFERYFFYLICVKLVRDAQKKNHAPALNFT